MEYLKLLLVFYQWRFSVWLFEDNKKWGKGRYMWKKKNIHKSHTNQVPFKNRNRHVGSKNSSDTCHREVFHNLKTSFIHHFKLIY